MYRLINNSKLPKFLKVLLIILLTLTCVYWIGLFIYKILEAIRKFVHWVSDKRNWWTFLMCIFILAIGSLLLAQFYFDLDPFGKLVNNIVEKWNDFREYLKGII